MKKLSIVAIFASVLSFSVFAEDIVLPKPAQKAGVDVLTAIQNRQISRSFVKRTVSPADMSTILWAGLGPRGADAVSSATKADRTISFSGDNAYINVYVLDARGTWKYMPESNSLKLVSSGDSRSAVSKAAIPEAAFMVLFTVNTELTPSFLKSAPAVFLQMAHATAGFSAQNMELAASALKMASIVQYSLTPAAAANAAKLGKEELPLFILQAGYTN